MTKVTKQINESWGDSNGKRWEDYDTIKCPDGQIIDMNKLLDEQQRAKAALVHIIPFFNGFINKLRPVYTFRVQTQATDGYNLFINPQFTYNLDLTEKVFVMAHEIMHCVLNHIRRGASHNPEKSNIAADYEVNSWINDIGLIKAATIKKLGALYDAKYSGWGYEKIYGENPPGPSDSMDNSDQSKQAEKNQQDNQKNQQGGQGKGKDGKQSNKQKGKGNDKSDSSDNSSKSNDSDGSSSSNSGDKNSSQSNSSSSSGNQSGQNSRTSQNDPNQGVVRPEDCASGSQSVQSTPKTPGGFFDKKEGDKLAEKEGYEKDGGTDSTVEREWKETAIKEANKLNAEPGTAMGKFKSTIEALYKTTTDWKKALRAIVGRSINPEDKRQAYANKNVLVAQNRIARTDKDKYDNVDYIMAWIDSSGSMSDDQLKMCLAEVYSVALAKKPMKLVVIQCDTTIQEIKEYTSMQALKKDIVKATVKGRGGTAIKPLWDLVRNDKKYSKLPPELIMIFTDGGVEAQYPRDKRKMRNLCWCIIDNPGFNLQYSDTMTKCIHLNSKDIK